MKIDGEAKKCSGCGACQSICPVDAISMEEDSQGFLRPAIDGNVCVECGLCGDVCPVGTEFTAKSGKNSCCIALKKKKKRMESQSGGAFAALAEEFLSNGGIVYGVEMQGLTAGYVRICSLKDLKKIKGSKYVQAVTGGIFRDVEADLLCRKEVLFSGTACYVNGLLHFLRAKGVNTGGLYTVDLVCEGVVSPGIFREYILVQEKRYGKVSCFNFRDNRVMNWGGHVISMEVGKRKIISRKYVDIFYSELCLRPSCYKCTYASLDRVADITLGDYWGIEKRHRKFADAKGVSLVLLNTEKGRGLFEKAKHRVVYQETSIEECTERQPNLRGGRGEPEEYKDFWDTFHSRGFLEAVGRYCNYEGTKDYEWTFWMAAKKKFWDCAYIFYQKAPDVVRKLYRTLKGGRGRLDG